MADRNFELIKDNYIYIFYSSMEDGEYFLIPSYPDQIKDSMQSTFSSQNALSRSAPVFSYSNSGPRTVDISVQLHRDMFDQINFNNGSLKGMLFDEDYVDLLVRKLMSIAVPKYSNSTKAVQVPQVAVRFGNQLFIKGIVVGNVNTSYDAPILDDNKYAVCNVQFQVVEVDPYDADTIAEQGSFRGITKTWLKGMFG